MNAIAAKLGEALPAALLLFVPLYFLLRKKVNQRALWGILGILWLMLAIILPGISTPKSRTGIPLAAQYTVSPAQEQLPMTSAVAPQGETDSTGFGDVDPQAFKQILDKPVAPYVPPTDSQPVNYDPTQAALKAVVKAAHESYPFLDHTKPYANPDAINEVFTRRVELEKRGIPIDQALMLAVREIAPKYASKPNNISPNHSLAPLPAGGRHSRPAKLLPNEEYSLLVKRIDNNLYKDRTSGIYIKTSLCLELALGDRAILIWDGINHIACGKLIFPESSNVCQVDEVFQAEE